MDFTLIILGLNNDLNLDDFQGYLQGPTGNLTHHETPRDNFRPRVHGVSRELTFDPVCTGVKRPVTRGIQRDFLDPLGTTLGPHRHEVTIDGYHEELFMRF